MKQMNKPARSFARDREPLAELHDIWKFFAGSAVLRGVELTVGAGEIRALIGGNGAGKSTLMKILAGLIRPDRGEVRIAGSVLGRARPSTAHGLGLYLVPQEAHIFPSQSVLRNLCAGLPRSPESYVAELGGLFRNLGVSLDLDVAGTDLEVADRQIVEILRGLLREARVLVLDEPTSALTPHETGALFETVRRLRDEGVAIVFISHKLREIRELCDTISVLRDGCIVLESALADCTDESIVQAMSRIDLPARDVARCHGADSPTVLELRRLCGEGFRDISLEVRAGEVLGIAGVVGSGRTELAETIVGLRPRSGGHLSLDDVDIDAGGLRSRTDAGIVYLTEDRQQYGLFLDAPLFWSTSSLVTHRLPLLSRASAERTRFERFREMLQIRCEGPDQAARRLSGGNQQKLLLSKCLVASPRVLILDEPTRGVDVGAREEIYAQIRSLASEGVAVLVISSDFEEIERLADRVLVMALGEVVGRIDDDAITLDTIARLAYGAQERRVA